MFGVATNTEALNTLGVPGLVFVIVVLAGVIVFIYRSKESELKLERASKEAIQEQRLVDARETRDKITEPLENQTKLSEKTYDLLLQLLQRGK